MSSGRLEAVKPQVRRVLGWPVRRVLDPRLAGLLEEITARQDADARATEAAIRSLADRIRGLHQSLHDLAASLASDDQATPPGVAADRSLRRAVGLSALAALPGVRHVLVVGDVGASPAALGIDADDGGGSEVDAILVVSDDLTEDVPVHRLVAGGALVMAVGPGAPAERLGRILEGFAAVGSLALTPAGEAGWDVEPHEPGREGASRLVVAHRAPSPAT